MNTLLSALIVVGVIGLALLVILFLAAFLTPPLD